ncbi:hypothetical protein ACFSS9_04000 [Paenibacillus septentrionalis]
MREVYEMATYLLLIIVSCIVMGVGLKRKAKKKESKSIRRVIAA